MIKNKGTFVTIDSGEGSGKSTLAKMLSDYYMNKFERCNVTLCNDPSNSTKELKILRDLILSNKNYNITKNTELMLYLASRAQLVDTIIKPALEANGMVICDRFFDSTTVYQGYMKRHSHDDLKRFNKLICGDIYPDMTILCDVDAKVGLQRSNNRLEDDNIDEGKWEAMGLKFHQKINDYYRYIAKQEPKRFFVIDSTNNSIDKMFKIAVKEINKRFFPNIFYRMIGRSSITNIMNF